LIEGAEPCIQGDADGVVVIPQEQAANILKRSQASVAKEQQVRERIARGEYLFDMQKLGEVLKSLGVVER
jgi:4-hydroxy-4-methyl-2-oxoglutarate aldolase